MRKTFEEIGFDDYKYWQKQDRKKIDRINELIKDIERNGPMSGIGNPERLKHIDAWSRRIDEANRLVYGIENDAIVIKSCKGHYDDK